MPVAQEDEARDTLIGNQISNERTVVLNVPWDLLSVLEERSLPFQLQEGVRMSRETADQIQDCHAL